MTLRDRRCRFSELLARLVLWILAHPGWEVALDEVTVHSPRQARRGVERLEVEDAVHKRGSFHHQGLAADLNLYIEGQYVSDGGHPAWQEIAEHWESLDPNCTSGVHWHDSNHVSYGEGK